MKRLGKPDVDGERRKPQPREETHTHTSEIDPNYLNSKLSKIDQGGQKFKGQSKNKTAEREEKCFIVFQTSQLIRQLFTYLLQIQPEEAPPITQHINWKVHVELKA